MKLLLLLQINFIHSHRLRVGEAFSYLRVNDETKNKFLEYFKMGMGPSAAHKFHEMSISGEQNFAMDVKLLANAQINPRLRQIYTLYDEWRYED